ncbi:MAG: IPT/TIG domain-containing protein [Planctomycetales bacterium]|nr:IPT/TIG domain-containing protein [Planctomycetales bacterium]
MTARGRIAELLAPAALAISGLLGCTGDAQERLAIADVHPKVGPLAGGTELTVEGRGFDADTLVNLLEPSGSPSATRSAATSVVIVSSRVLLARTPAGSGGYADVEVVRGRDRAVLAGAFRYAALPPTVTGLSPNTGPAAGGTLVTISGTGFLTGITVTIGGTAATGVTRVDANTLTATTPAGAAGSANVTVTNPDIQSATLAGGFTYIAPPTVAGIVPASGPTVGGSAVTLSGTGFQGGATVTVGGILATDVIVVSATTILARTPASSPAGTTGAASVTVTNPDAQSGSLAGPSPFTYNPTRLFVAHSTSNDVAVLNFTDSTGALAAATGSPFGAGTGASGTSALASYFDPSGPGTVLYAANTSSNSITAYTVNATTGALTMIGSGPTILASGGLGPSLLRVVALTTGGRVLYSLNVGNPPTTAPSVSILSINGTTGALTELGGTPPQSPVSLGTGTSGPADWVISGATLFVSCSGSDQISALGIGTTGALTPLTGSPVSTGSGSGPTVLHVLHGGAYLYASHTAAGSLGGYQIAVSSPLIALAGTPISTGSGSSPLGIATNSGALFVAGSGTGNVAVFSVSTSTGALGSVTGSPFAAGTTPVAAEVLNGRLYAFNTGSQNISAWAIGTTGGLTVLATTPAPPYSTGATGQALWQVGASRLFVLDAGGAAVIPMTVTPSTGLLTSASGAATGGTAAADLLVSP